MSRDSGLGKKSRSRRIFKFRGRKIMTRLPGDAADGTERVRRAQWASPRPCAVPRPTVTRARPDRTGPAAGPHTASLSRSTGPAHPVSFSTAHHARQGRACSPALGLARLLAGAPPTSGLRFNGAGACDSRPGAASAQTNLNLNGGRSFGGSPGRHPGIASAQSGRAGRQRSRRAGHCPAARPGCGRGQDCTPLNGPGVHRPGPSRFL